MKDIYVLMMMMMLVVAGLSGCVDGGVETNATIEENMTNVTKVEVIEVIETADVVETSGNITVGFEMNMTNGTAVDSEYVEGSVGYSVN